MNEPKLKGEASTEWEKLEQIVEADIDYMIEREHEEAYLKHHKFERVSNGY